MRTLGSFYTDPFVDKVAKWSEVRVPHIKRPYPREGSFTQEYMNMCRRMIFGYEGDPEWQYSYMKEAFAAWEKAKPLWDKAHNHECVLGPDESQYTFPAKATDSDDEMMAASVSAMVQTAPMRVRDQAAAANLGRRPSSGQSARVTYDLRDVRRTAPKAPTGGKQVNVGPGPSGTQTRAQTGEAHIRTKSHTTLEQETVWHREKVHFGCDELKQGHGPVNQTRKTDNEKHYAIDKRVPYI